MVDFYGAFGRVVNQVATVFRRNLVVFSGRISGPVVFIQVVFENLVDLLVVTLQLFGRTADRHGNDMSFGLFVPAFVAVEILEDSDDLLVDGPAKLGPGIDEIEDIQGVGFVQDLSPFLVRPFRV